MVGRGEIKLCVCLMGEHYALSGCDLTSRVRTVVRKGKARILNFARARFAFAGIGKTLSYF
jgi:hypothetical protein